MARVSVAQAEGEIVLFDGVERHVYKVKDGTIVVADAHLAAVLVGVPGSELKQETPAKEASPSRSAT